MTNSIKTPADNTINIDGVNKIKNNAYKEIGNNLINSDTFSKYGTCKNKFKKNASFELVSLPSNMKSITKHSPGDILTLNDVNQIRTAGFERLWTKCGQDHVEYEKLKKKFKKDVIFKIHSLPNINEITS